MKKTTTTKNEIDEDLAKKIIDTAADAVVTYIGLSIMAELLVDLAKNLDAEEWKGICDQLEALFLYPETALKPEV